MTFEELRIQNARRCNESFHPLHDWSPTDWGCALAGEVGELCNMLKKLHRGDFTLEQQREAIAKEIGDVQLYLDLLATRLGINLEEATRLKFNEVSDRVSSSRKLDK